MYIFNDKKEVQHKMVRNQVFVFVSMFSGDWQSNTRTDLN